MKNETIYVDSEMESYRIKEQDDDMALMLLLLAGVLLGAGTIMLVLYG